MTTRFKVGIFFCDSPHSICTFEIVYIMCARFFLKNPYAPRSAGYEHIAGVALLFPGNSMLVGEILSPVLPSPNCPCQLSPQQLTDLVSVMAQVWYEPEDTDTAVSPLPKSTETGLSRFVLVPSPICPLLFSPQHFTPESSNKAQVCDSPADTLTAVLPEPGQH